MGGVLAKINHEDKEPQPRGPSLPGKGEVLGQRYN